MNDAKEQKARRIWKRVLITVTALWVLALLCFTITAFFVILGVEHGSLYKVEKYSISEALWMAVSMPFLLLMSPVLLENSIIIGIPAVAFMIYLGMKKFFFRKLHLRYGFALLALLTIPSFYTLVIMLNMQQ